MSEQRTNSWFEQRMGRFTASDIHALMNLKGFGEVGMKLIRKKAQEIVFGRDESWNVNTWDMRRGIEQEEVAFYLFKEMKELDFIDVEKASFFPLGENSGASPDGLVGLDAVLEIKCPRPEKFFEVVELGIEGIEKKYIYQMQLQMKATNSVKAHFFNYVEWNGRPLTHEVIVPYDESIVKVILKRIDEAVKERDNIIKELINNCQFKHLLTPTKQNKHEQE